MDDRRFDAFVKSLAGGTSRRRLFKGLLGLGGAAIAGQSRTDAARRPPSTPTPVPRCPGRQFPSGTQCICPTGLSTCGPDCCNDDEPRVLPSGANNPAYSECCDNACCFGKCYGEEQCCPSTRTWCEATGECCPVDRPYCCGTDGCCATPCCDTTAGLACCDGQTPKCCPGDICVPEGTCCTKGDCPGCQDCIDHVCVDADAYCPGGVAGCQECRSAVCQRIDANCDDGSACTQNICNADGSCSNPFDCNDQDACCDDGNACTQNICNANGTCSNPFDCNGQNACCDDGNACTQNICNANGTCSNPFFCTADSCCPAGQQCNLQNGQCFTPCVGLGEVCTNNPCCNNLSCYSILGGPGVCGPCIPDLVPCGLACDYCCSENSIAGVCTPDICLPEDAPCLADSNCCSNSCTGIIPTCD